MADPPREPDPDLRPEDRAPAMPRWVKVFAIIALVLVVLVVIALLAGGHGPSQHMSDSAVGVGTVGGLWARGL
jgi:hypothetical protein